VHDDRRLVDQRQPLLHPVVECGACGGAKLLNVMAKAVTRGERDQRHRLMCSLTQSRKDLTSPGTPRGVDRRA
jgi:hypothetical protein